jgi:hypothetical protein
MKAFPKIERELYIMTKKNYPDTMNAVVAYAPGDYRYETVETPTIENVKKL